jgi:acetyl esterase/lipase
MSIAAGRVSALFALVYALVAGPAVAQQAPPPAQALAEMRADVQGRADHQAYPITGINRDDVREVLATLKSIDRDEWAAAWSAMGERHAKEATAASDTVQKREHWRQAWLDYHFGAWPAQNTDGKRAAYKKAVEAFRAYAALLDPPAETVRIPFEGKEIVGYLRLPAGAGAKPVVISIGGLDEYKEFGVEHVSGPLVSAGLGSLSLDMPGTGEAPVKMEVGAERMISKAIDYLISRPEVDARRIAVNGASAGGYWSALAAYSERTRIRAAVAQGAPIHEYFQADWQRKSWGTSEYLFGLKEARMFVYGFKDDEEAKFLAKLATFSLKTRGVLKDPSAPMLVVNGEQDTQVPIADLYLLLKTGTPKFAWVNPEGGHTGRSKEWPQDKITGEVVAPWLATMTAVAPASH